MKQLTKKQALALSQTEFWKELTPHQITRFQLFQRRLCMPFSVFHEAVEKSLMRSVWVHEFGLNLKGLQAEFGGQYKAPTFKEIINLIPEEKRIIIGI